MLLALWGPPCSGKSTIARILRDASKKDIHVVEWGDHEDPIAEARAHTAIVFLVGVPDKDAIAALNAERTLDTAVYVSAEPADLKNWGYDPTAEEQEEWKQRRSEIERALWTFSIPAAVVFNVSQDIEAPIGQLARIAKVRS